MGVVVNVDGTLDHAQATMERFAAELGGRFKVKSVVEKVGIEKASRTPASSGVSTLPKRMSHKPWMRRKIC